MLFSEKLLHLFNIYPNLDEGNTGWEVMRICLEDEEGLDGIETINEWFPIRYTYGLLRKYIEIYALRRHVSYYENFEIGSFVSKN